MKYRINRIHRRWIFNYPGLGFFFFVAEAEAINKLSFREPSPAVLSASRSLLGAVFAPLASPAIRGCPGQQVCNENLLLFTERFSREGQTEEYVIGSPQPTRNFWDDRFCWWGPEHRSVCSGCAQTPKQVINIVPRQHYHKKSCSLKLPAEGSCQPKSLTLKQSLPSVRGSRTATCFHVHKEGDIVTILQTHSDQITCVCVPQPVASDTMDTMA